MATVVVSVSIDEVVSAVAEEGGEDKVDNQRVIQKSKRIKNNKLSSICDVIEPCSEQEETIQPNVSENNSNMNIVTSSSVLLASSSNDQTSHAPPASGIGTWLINHLHSWRKLPKSSFACNIISKGVRLPFVNKMIARRILKRYGVVRNYSFNKRNFKERM